MSQQSEINLKLRYYDWVQTDEASRVEKNGKIEFKEWQVNPKNLGLVLLDVWNIAHLNDVTQRAEQITREKIVPLRDAFSERSLHVIHAPSPEVALLYNSSPQQASSRSSEGSPCPQPEFRQLTGKQAQFQRYSNEKTKVIEDLQSKRRIHPSVTPRKGEYVASTGEDIDHYCREHEISVLLYVGFSTNFCIISRDYGIVQMRRRGYETVLVRDCTTGIETAETAESQTLTKSTIRSLEMSQHYTMTSSDLITALSS